MEKGDTVSKKPVLMIIADAAVDTGFAQVTHNLIDNLYHNWDIHVLAINYYGDPHDIQKKASLWSPTGVTQGDVYGLSRVKTLLDNLQPKAVLMINDPWVLSQYKKALKDTPGKKIAYVPIDAENIKPVFVTDMNVIFDHVIGYTQFGIDQLVHAGLTTPTSVIPHGVDTNMFFPVNKAEVREKAGLDPKWFIVQMVDRNQQRKRIDLGLYYFSQWVHMTHKPNHVKFYYHGALLDEGWDISQLAQEFGVADRLIISHQNLNPAHGFPVDVMKYVYNVADVKLSTTLGEGWGLTTMESMACRIANIVPNYSALGEWPKGGVYHTDISPIPLFNTKGINTRGGLADMASTIKALQKLYDNSDLRHSIAKAGYDLVKQQKFTWKAIAMQFEHVFNTTIQKDISDD